MGNKSDQKMTMEMSTFQRWLRQIHKIRESGHGWRERKEGCRGDGGGERSEVEERERERKRKREKEKQQQDKEDTKRESGMTSSSSPPAERGIIQYMTVLMISIVTKLLITTALYTFHYRHYSTQRCSPPASPDDPPPLHLPILVSRHKRIHSRISSPLTSNLAQVRSSSAWTCCQKGKKYKSHHVFLGAPLNHSYTSLGISLMVMDPSVFPTLRMPRGEWP